MHPNYCQITILLVVDLCSSLAYFMMTHPLPIAGKLPIKTLGNYQQCIMQMAEIYISMHTHRKPLVLALTCTSIMWVSINFEQCTIRYMYKSCLEVVVVVGGGGGWQGISPLPENTIMYISDLRSTLRSPTSPGEHTYLSMRNHTYIYHVQ